MNDTLKLNIEIPLEICSMWYDWMIVDWYFDWYRLTDCRRWRVRLAVWMRSVSTAGRGDTSVQRHCPLRQRSTFTLAATDPRPTAASPVEVTLHLNVLLWWVWIWVCIVQGGPSRSRACIYLRYVWTVLEAISLDHCNVRSSCWTLCSSVHHNHSSL